MFKKGILMGLGLYLALFIAGAAFNSCKKTEKSAAEKLAPILLLTGQQQAASYFVTIPQGVAY